MSVSRRFALVPRHRRSLRASRRLIAGALALLLVSACTSQTGAAVTVTRQVTAGLPSSATVAASTAPSDSAGRPTALVTRLAGPVTPSPTTHAPTTTSSAPAVLGGFVPTKLRPGQKAPQFIVVSFDGVGWHEKWQYWRDIAAKVPFRFTGFLTGVYLQAPAVKTDLQQQAPELGPPGQ